MTFWSGDKLKVELAQPAKIVDPYHPSKVDCSAYTLTLGEESFVTPDHETKPRSNTRLLLAKPRSEEYAGVLNKIGGGSVTIPPGQFAFLLTEELLEIPHNVMGFISLKSAVKWNGLINVSGFHVDPGFKGRLVYSVYNAGPATIHLSRGQDLFLLWLTDLDPSASQANARNAKSPNLEISDKLITTVNYPSLSVQNLSKRIEDLENKLKTYVTVIAAIVTIFSLGFSGYKLLQGNNSTVEVPKSPPVDPKESDAARAPKDVLVPQPSLSPNTKENRVRQ